MINWMDNFNIYGTDGGRTARMLNGVYAEVTNCDLQVDPDPTAGGGQVLRCYSLGNGGITRKVLPVARTTVGIAARYWLAALPSIGTQHPVLASFRDVNDNRHISITVNSVGWIEVYRGDSVAGTSFDFWDGARTKLGDSGGPVMVANAWKHVETKVVLDAAAGSVEVRVEGATVVNLAGIRTTNAAAAAASCAQVGVGNSDNGPQTLYVKDFIVWDGTGASNNNFMGSCQVLKITPQADVALNWTPSGGGTGFNLINEVTPDDDATYISAPTPAPAAYKCSLTDLPLTVTSVRGVMPIHRSRKTDGGDGNIQVGAISGAATGLGVDRPITTAYTYWWDIFDTDPNTLGAWSRLSVNAMNLQLNRSL
jgi:hypothetical protein